MELFKLLLKPWASVNEIQLISNCGRDTAIKIRNTIKIEIAKDNKQLPRGKTIIVPTKNVIELLGLDMQYITDMANQEMKMFNEEDRRNLGYASISK